MKNEESVDRKMMKGAENDILNEGMSNSHNRRLQNYLSLVGPAHAIPAQNWGHALSQIVQMLIVNRLQNKAEREEAENMSRRASRAKELLAYKAAHEKDMEELRERLMLGKESRQHKRDLEKINMQQILDGIREKKSEAREERREQRRGATDHDKMIEKLRLESIKDPQTRVNVAEGKKKYEDLKPYDDNGLLKKALGAIRNKIKKGSYQPKLMLR